MRLAIADRVSLSWLEEIPQHWGLVRFKHISRMSTERCGSRAPTPKMLSVSGYHGIIPKQYDDESQRRPPEEVEDYRVVRPNQLVLNTMWLNFRGLGVSGEYGIVSPAYRAYWLNDCSVPRYLHYLLRTNEYVAEYTRLAYGIRPNSLQVNRNDFGRLPVCLPPLPEQRSIADFLDRKTAAIDELIRAKERLIELLEEKRQALITQAVTKGLDPSVPMKDSGIEWLGEVPEHWEVALLRLVARIESGHTPSRQHPEYWIPDVCTTPWFSLADVWQLRDGRKEYLGDTSEKVSERGLANSSARLLPAGTVILSRTASVGFSGIMPLPMATTQDFANWVCGSRISPEYLLYSLRAMTPDF